MKKSINIPFSIVYQITQECPFNCEICLRYYNKNEKPLSHESRKKMVDILKKCGLKRLAITGGEPTTLGDNLFDFLKYAHNNKIHTSLITTSLGLTENKIYELNNYLDHLLISVRTLNMKNLGHEFGNPRLSNNLFESLHKVLQAVKTTEIIVEVNTVVHRKNIDSILSLGDELLQLNSNVIWRLDEYYPIGLTKRFQEKYNLEKRQFENIKEKVYDVFANSFRGIRFLSCSDRVKSPEFFITHSGYLMKTSYYKEQKTDFDLINEVLPSEFKNLRTWSEHNKVCRDFNWK